MVIFRQKEYREKVPSDILEKAKTEGVIQKDKNGVWRIVAIKKGEFWDSHYTSRENALKALRGYQANK